MEVRGTQEVIRLTHYVTRKFVICIGQRIRRFLNPEERQLK